MLTSENASNYIQSFHVAIPCEILFTQADEIDGIPLIKVTFNYRGNVFCADVWIEGGKLYGEW